ncbi:oligoribonuclease [Haloactinopolyspora sp.]|uniref:oligoribonuclease n=1 Tax=Haloactinopolyspora sp. TaxID=1966353 RepID=UPI0034430C9F
MVWIDCEMTGLDLEHDALIEVAVLVTDGELNVLGDGVDVVIRPPDLALKNMSDVVREMHTASRLLDVLEDGITLEEASARIMEYIKAHVPEASKAQLAGNTVHMDRLFLARDLPEVESYLHYRNIDVSSIKELVRRWYPRVYFASPEKTGNHRALGDIKDSINELRYYRETVFVPQPGPDTNESRAAAVSVTNAAASSSSPSDETSG